MAGGGGGMSLLEPYVKGGWDGGRERMIIRGMRSGEERESYVRGGGGAGGSEPGEGVTGSLDQHNTALRGRRSPLPMCLACRRGRHGGRGGDATSGLTQRPP